VVTPLEVAIISPAAALVGVALGGLGTAYQDRVRQRRAARREQRQAIAELLTATVDLVTAAQAVRSAYQQQRWTDFIRRAAVIVSAIGGTMDRGEGLTLNLLRWDRVGPGFERVLAELGQRDDRQRTIALDMATVVVPRSSRFYAAVATLTLGDDKEITVAVRELANAVGAFMETLGDKDRKYASARDRVTEALGNFRTVADHPDHRRG
jgi:hypothetical protein